MINKDEVISCSTALGNLKAQLQYNVVVGIT